VLMHEIERLKRRIRSSSRSNSTVDEDDFDLDGEAEFDAAAPASTNVPREGSTGKLDPKIRMPFPY
jgi:hypothetical protein